MVMDHHILPSGDNALLLSLAGEALGQREALSSLFLYDIETTSLSAEKGSIYLIGGIYLTEGNSEFFQWYADEPEEERLILSSFSESPLGRSSVSVTYNGDAFDRPFICKRAAFQDLPEPPFPDRSLDLYKKLACLKKPLALQSMKQPAMEGLLSGAEPREYPDGGECLRVYRQRHMRSDAADILMGHNREDLMGLKKIMSLLSCLPLFTGSFSVTESREVASEGGKCLVVTASLPHPLPIPVVIESGGCRLEAREREMRFSVCGKNGKYRQYYRDYKNYDYIPSEDMAMPKRLSAFLDRSLRKSARAENCYTYFSCTEEFLHSRERQQRFLEEYLHIFLNLR